MIAVKTRNSVTPLLLIITVLTLIAGCTAPAVDFSADPTQVKTRLDKFLLPGDRVMIDFKNGSRLEAYVVRIESQQLEVRRSGENTDTEIYTFAEMRRVARTGAGGADLLAILVMAAAVKTIVDLSNIEF
jgi:hypothetical protein